MKEIALSIDAPDPAAPAIVVDTPPNVPGSSAILGNAPMFIVSVLIVFVIVAAVVMIIISGIQWMTSGGDSKKIEGARGRLTYAIIGLIVALAAMLIVGTVIRLAGGNPNLFNIGDPNQQEIDCVRRGICTSNDPSSSPPRPNFCPPLERLRGEC